MNENYIECIQSTTFNVWNQLHCTVKCFVCYCLSWTIRCQGFVKHKIVDGKSHYGYLNNFNSNYNLNFNSNLLRTNADCVTM